LERTPSSLRLALRPATAWSQIHSLRVQLVDLVHFPPTQTYTTEEYKLRTSC